jgi:hypothetical protein
MRRILKIMGGAMIFWNGTQQPVMAMPGQWDLRVPA